MDEVHGKGCELMAIGEVGSMPKEISKNSMEISEKKESIFPDCFKHFGQEIKNLNIGNNTALINRRDDKIQIDRKFGNESGCFVNKVNGNPDKVLTHNDIKSGEYNIYKNLQEAKPPHSPDIAKWLYNGGSIIHEPVAGKEVWTFIDKDERTCRYIDGNIVFPSDAKHNIIQDISIGRFTGDRNEDKRLYLESLYKQYGIRGIPDGYVLHHDSKNGNMQLIKGEYHKTFTHTGGHSLFKEG